MERFFPFLADTSGPYKQLLAAEQTAQSVQALIQEKKDAIRTIKQQAVDQCLPYNATYGHIKQLDGDIVGFKRLLESNETSRRHWREMHMAAWRATVRSLKVVDMPNEVLTKIFANFENVPVPQIQTNSSQFDGPLPSPDLASIKNIRLTCRDFCEVGSEFLLPIVDVSFTLSSLECLKEISSHPTIRKSVRIIRFDISPYSSCLCDRQWFSHTAFTRLDFLRAHFDAFAKKVRVDVIDTLYSRGYRADPTNWMISGLDEAQDHARAISNEGYRQTWSHGFSSVPTPSPLEQMIRDAITGAHEEFRKRCLEQRTLFEDHQVCADIQSYIRRMPSAHRIYITDLPGRHWHHRFLTRVGGVGRTTFDAQKYNSVVMGPNPFHELMVRPGVCDDAVLAGDGEPPLSLLYRLPSLFQAINQNLTHLDIDIKPDPTVHIEISTEAIQTLRYTCQHLKSIKLRFVKPYPLLAYASMTAENIRMVNSLLGAMLGSPELEELRVSMNLSPPSRQDYSRTILGSVPTNLSGHKLRGVWLSSIAIRIDELRQLLERAPEKVHVFLRGIHLLDGTWARVLDILRGRADCTSQIISPRGGEMSNMSERETWYFQNEFESEHRDGWYSRRRCPGPASFYIRGGDIPNPLIWGNED